MKRFLQTVRRLIVAEDGPTAVEYAVMLAVILGITVGVIRMIGSGANTVFSQIGSAIQ